MADGTETTPNTRDLFVARFGEEQARAVEMAADEHANRWALCICIGYECMSKDRFREYHGITAPWDEIRQWIKDEARLDKHDGDVDYLGLFTGAYNEFMPERAK